MRSELPTAELQIVGRRPPRQLRRHDGAVGVTVTGTVPDIRPHLARAWVSVAPLQIARGVQNKVLEAMAAKIPTMISPAVARGLSAEDGVETLVANSAADWRAGLQRLLADQTLRRQLACSGWRHVTATHDWTTHGDRWLSLLDETVSQKTVRLNRRHGKVA